MRSKRQAGRVLVGFVVLVVSCVVWGMGGAGAVENVQRLAVSPWPITGTDLTTGRTPTCSGSTTFSGSCAATNDGNEATGWTPTNTNNTAVVVIDFGSVKNLRYIYVAGKNEHASKAQSVTTSYDCSTFASLYLIEDDPPSHQALIDIGDVRQARCIRVRIDHGAVYEIHAYEDGAIPTTTTTTIYNTTTTTNPDDGLPGRIERFEEDDQPFWVSAVAGQTGWQEPKWSAELGALFSVTGPLTQEEWEGGLIVQVVPLYDSLTFTVGASGFSGSAGCEVWTGPDFAGISYTGKKLREGQGRYTIPVTVGQPRVLALGHDGGSGDSGSTCTLDNIERVLDAVPGEPPNLIDLDGDGVPDNVPEGPSSTGQDGLDDCIPSGWSLVNPFAYVGALGCVMEWAFVPSADTFDVAEMKAEAEEKVPFSWLIEMKDAGDGFADVLDHDEVLCGHDSGIGDWFEDRFGVEQEPGGSTKDWDDLNGSDCSFQGNSGTQLEATRSEWGPRVRSMFSVLLWLGLASRLAQSAPWSKGKDGGEG